MKLELLDIPEDVGAIPTWLERQIMGPALGQLAAQLEILKRQVESHSGSDTESMTLNQILGESRRYVLDHGLVSCSQYQIRQLLDNPSTLLELQDQVYQAESDYWFHQVEVESNAEHMEQLKSRVLPSSTSNVMADSKPVQSPDRTSLPFKQKRPSILWPVLAVAAAVLIMASIGYGPLQRYFNNPDQFAQNFDPDGSLNRWGWLSEDALPKTNSPRQYLAALADGGQAWFNKTPETVDDYIQRLTEMQAGCQLLIDAEHEVLSDAQKQWLVDKCKAWKVKFDAQLAGAQSSPDDFEVYLSQTNDTVNSLVKALNEKATSV